MSDIRLAVTLYSLTPDFCIGGASFEDLIRRTAELPHAEGIEVVGFQSIRGFPTVDPSTRAGFERLIEETGLVPVALDADSDVWIRPGRQMTEDELVDYLTPQIDAAQSLGFPILRVQHTASPVVLRRLLPYAEQRGVTLVIEIHAPYTARHPKVQAFADLFDDLDSEFIGFCPDFGTTTRRIPPIALRAWRERGVSAPIISAIEEAYAGNGDPLERQSAAAAKVLELGGDATDVSVAMLALDIFGTESPDAWRELVRHVRHVHGKFYEVVDGQEPAIPYPELLRALHEEGYSGWISSEWEGYLFSEADSGFPVVRDHLEMEHRILSDLRATR